MTLIKSIKGTMRLTTAGKEMISKSMYMRGRQFLLAALLLNERVGKNYVYLHIICQGIEISLKSALLFKDYDKYKPQLKPLNHDLKKVLEAYLLEYEIKRIDKRIYNEISELNIFYEKHRLRYASSVDILIDPKSIKSNWTMKFITRLIKSFDEKFNLRSTI